MASSLPEVELPSAVKSLWRSLRLGYRAEPMLLALAAGTTLAAAVPDALFALGLKFLAQAVGDGDRGRILFAALGLGLLTTGAWLLKTVSERANRKFADRSTVVIESHVAKLQATVATIEHHERPDYLDRLSRLRDQVFALNHLYGSLFSTAGAVLRLVLTLGLLMSVHPALIVLGVFAVPTVWVSSWRAGVEQVVYERGAQHLRRARHLFVLGTTAAPGKEIRVAGNQQRLLAGRAEAWDGYLRPLARARWVTAALQSFTWALFGAAYVGCVVYVASTLHRPAGDVLLVLAAGSRLSSYIGQTVSEANFLRGIWLDASQRLAWLEDYAASRSASADAAVPSRLVDGIRFEGVSFSYPGTDRVVLEDVNLALPAGSVVAVVGENGAGKTTLVKLLCRFYDPSSGRITVDGVDLARIPPIGWRLRLAGAFQDFFRFEYQVRRSVGLGDLDRADDVGAVEMAVDRAGAADVVGKLPAGLETQLGPTWHDGVEVSFGQWQKLALARGFMRDDPLVLVLDEPTAALDAETEHALFERYAAAARAADGGANGRLTVLVSHRFSTVRMADLIVVLDGSRVVEFGSHEDLMALGGQYAELYGIQASSYR
ncbi:MAG: ATP-binding cassette, subfamily bacterial [Actinomycetota bacterium]|jgi:ATP-binding cassette subfamily B protein|nr:ATP-binding cassette, subfamily bacterial [Actinomycetota bacterium]